MNADQVTGAALIGVAVAFVMWTGALILFERWHAARERRRAAERAHMIGRIRMVGEK